MDEAKRPVTIFAGRYGHPVHPVLVAIPIGAWVASLVFDLASHAVPDPGFLADGSRWLIGVGILGALVAASAGFLDLLAIPGRTRVFRTAVIHMSVALTTTAVYLVAFALRADPVAPVPWSLVALSAVALAGLTATGYLGGSLAYRYGVRVADEQTQAEGYHAVNDTTSPADTSPHGTKEND